MNTGGPNSPSSSEFPRPQQPDRSLRLAGPARTAESFGHRAHPLAHRLDVSAIVARKDERIVPKPFRDSARSGPPQDERQQPAPGGSEATLETVGKPRRRVFSAADKLRIVKEADRCLASGKRGALGQMLRKEGIYSSLVSTWRHRLGCKLEDIPASGWTATEILMKLRWLTAKLPIASLTDDARKLVHQIQLATDALLR